jgi:hypothetical protein
MVEWWTAVVVKSTPRRTKEKKRKQMRGDKIQLIYL